KVRNIYKTQLWIVDRLIFLLAFSDVLKLIKKKNNDGACIIAELDGQLVGSMLVQTFEISGQKHGLIDAIVTNKSIRGKGLGKKLLKECLRWFDNNGCENIYATVERYNSRSWNLFMHTDFSLYEFKQQISDLKAGFLKLWAKEMYFIGIGLFFLKLNKEKKQFKESTTLEHFAISFVGFSLIVLIYTLMWGNSISVFPYLIILVAVTILLHEISHSIVAKIYGLKTEFKSWIPGLFFWFLLSLLGGIYPAYGSTYMSKRDWSYVKNKRKNGLIYIIGPIVNMIIILTLYLVFPYLTIDPLKTAFGIISFINIVILIVNLLPFRGSGGFPWDGGKIYDWNKIVWGIMVVLAILLMVFYTL
ncbi:MAG: GNAT family N-acetyltransferase, partial [Candidatus Lokiarchaeota archaeon]|nr:GNAT family N-acetyltransferase [Candidatus Lokiarchaeota archaeon]